MKKFTSLLCMVAMASTMMISCDTSDDGSGDVEKKKEFASIEVVANERYERDMDDDNVPDVAEKLKACTKSASKTTIPSVNFTVKVDVNDDSDTRDYMIATVPASIVEREGGALSNIRKYFAMFELYLSMENGLIEWFEESEVIKSGDVDKSVNLFEKYPILTHDKQCVVCIPIEGETFKYDEASVSKPISVARLFDPNEISFPTSELECTIEFENVESFDADYKIKGLDENEFHVCSYDIESVYNSLSAEEIYVRTMERAYLDAGTAALAMLFEKSLEGFYDVDSIYGQVETDGYMDFDYDDTNYTVYIFSADPDAGVPTSAIKTVTVKTADYVAPTGQMAGFKNLEAGISDLTVDIDNGTYDADDAYYLTGCVSYEEMKEYGCTTMEELAKFFVDMYKALGISFEAGFSGYMSGYDPDSLCADSEYFILAFGVSVKGDITTNIISQDFKTLPIPDDFSVSIDLQSADVNDFCCDFTPSQYDVRYSYAIIESSEIEGMSDAEIIKYAEDGYAEDADFNCGGYTTTYDWFDAGTDYTICVYVVNAKGEALMPLVTEEFTATEVL